MKNNKLTKKEIIEILREQNKEDRQKDIQNKKYLDSTFKKYGSERLIFEG